MKKRILAMLLCIVMCASLMSVAAFAEESTSSNFYKDEDGIWHIANEQGLVELSDAVANGKNFAKEVVSLDKDLDMSGISDFQPIGSKSAEKEFRGYFLGNNHTIKNLTISSTDYKEGFALFGNGKCANDDYTVADAFIKDLTLENVNVSCPGGKYVGILVGYGYEQIENCKIVNCSVEGGYQVGGYAGFLFVGYIRNSSIENCSVLANS